MRDKYNIFIYDIDNNTPGFFKFFIGKIYILLNLPVAPLECILEEKGIFVLIIIKNLPLKYFTHTEKPSQTLNLHTAVTQLLKW